MVDLQSNRRFHHEGNRRSDGLVPHPILSATIQQISHGIMAYWVLAMLHLHTLG
jgi:hypothetical protein